MTGTRACVAVETSAPGVDPSLTRSWKKRRTRLGGLFDEFVWEAAGSGLEHAVFGYK